MNQEWRSLRLGAAVILCALVLKLYAVGFFDPAFRWIASPNTASFLIYLQTGRKVEPVLATMPPETAPPATEAEASAPPEETEPPQPLPIFTQEDAALVDITYEIEARPDIPALMQQPLDWDLRDGEPRVLIVHTHATESYMKQPEDTYEESAVCRTLDEEHNMIRVGEALTEQLRQAGIGVLHDTNLHDYPSYNGSYVNSRETVEAYLEKYPTIRLVLDLHRDAAEDAEGNQIPTFAKIGDDESAQLMVVVGSNGSGLDHPNWEENLSLGLKLHVQMERIFPGICRDLDLCAQRFNQDLSPQMLLVEVGTAGNTITEAIRGVQVLGQAIIAIADGTE